MVVKRSFIKGHSFRISLYNYKIMIFFFIFLQINSQRRTQWVFECSRAFIFGWRSGTDRNQSLETVASEKHYLIHRWVLFFIFCAKVEKIREIEVLNEFLNVRAHLYSAWVPDQTGTKLKVRLSQNEYMKSSIFQTINWKINDFIHLFWLNLTFKNKFYLSFTRKQKQIENERFNEFLDVRAYLFLAGIPGQTGTSFIYLLLGNRKNR
jgi:hypothetical protein